MKGLIFFVVFCYFFSFVSATPFIVGQVNDALDGTSANGRTIVLWNPSLGLEDNVTDTIGTSGNSGVDNIFLIDCALLSNGCNVGDNIHVKVFGTNGRVTNYTNITITGAGFQQVNNLTLNTPSQFNYTFVDDSISSPSGEIDLFAGSTQAVSCNGVIYDLDTEADIYNVSSVFFDSSNSFFEDLDDNNRHYTNSSCFLNRTYGNNRELSFSCGYNISYYANTNNWNCTVSFNEYWGYNASISNSTFINPLLAVYVQDSINFGDVFSLNVSSEIHVNITNFGNVFLNLSLEGYAQDEGDNSSMICSLGNDQNISIGYQKYNLSSSNPGNLNLAQFESLYSNLTSTRVIRNFNLPYRQNDVSPYTDDTNITYWRIYVPENVDGTCTGNVIFGAERMAGT